MIYTFEKTIVEDIEANEYSEAKEKADGTLKKIDGEVVIGFCSKSGQPIKASDNYLISNNSVMYLESVFINEA